MKKLVAVMLKRLPVVEDYRLVGLTSGSDEQVMEFGTKLVNALMPQFNDNLLVNLSDTDPAAIHAGEAVIHFECDVEELAGCWTLPARMFEITDYEAQKHFKD